MGKPTITLVPGPSDSVAVPRATLEQIRAALTLSVDTIVALEGIFDAADDGLTHGLTEAARLCVDHQSELVCDAQNALCKLMPTEASNG